MPAGMSVSPLSRQSTIVSVHEHRAGQADDVEQSSSPSLGSARDESVNYQQ